MKRILSAAAVAQLAWSAAALTTNEIRDVPTALAALPAIEAQWPQNPQAYLATANKAAHELLGAANDPEASRAAVHLYESLMAKAGPTHESQATNWYPVKTDLIYSCFHNPGICEEKGCWLKLAQFLGEIRTRTIPHYKDQGIGLIEWPAITPKEVERRSKFIEENEIKKTSDLLQRELRMADKRACLLLRYVMADKLRSDHQFIHEVAQAGHLGAEEESKLRK